MNWEDFACGAGKRLQICTHHGCHIIFLGGMDNVASPLCPSSPLQTTYSASSGFHIPSWALFYLVLSNLIHCSIACTSNSKTSEMSSYLSPSLSSFLHHHTALFHAFFSNSLLWSSLFLILILPSHMSSASFTNSHAFFYPHLAALLSSHPLSFYSSFHLHPPASSVIHPFISSHAFRLFAHWLYFTPLCPFLRSYLPSTPITHPGGSK